MKLNCSVVKDIYVLYEEKELSEEVRGYVEEHLTECEECRRTYESGVSLPDALEERIPEPSEKLDEKMLLKLKLSRLRVAIVFILVVVVMASFSLYSQSRTYLVRDFQEYAQNLYNVYYQVESINRLEKSEEGARQFNHSSGEILNRVNESYEQAVRNFNLFESFGIKKSYPNDSFNLQMTILILTLNNRYQNGSFSKTDEVVYKRLTDELKKVALTSSSYGSKLNSKLFIMDTRKLKESLDKLNTLADVYVRYNMLPEDLKYLSQNELKNKIANVFGEEAKNITLIKSYDYKYIYKINSKKKESYTGEIDKVTGRILAINGGSAVLLKGDLIEVEKVKETIRDITIRNLGEGFDVKIDYQGINVNFHSDRDIKVYTFNVQPTFRGYPIFDFYNVMVDARKNSFYSYRPLEISGNNPFASSLDLKAEEKYNPENALKNLFTSDINKDLFKYKNTIFIKSMFTGKYELVHYYKEEVDTTKASSRDLYINAETGRVEQRAYSDNGITY